MRKLRENLIPPSGLPTKIAFLNLLFGIGRGAFLTGSAVYFTRMVELEAWQIGVGITLAAGAAAVTAVPVSALSDRFGPKQSWLFSVAAQGMLFALFPVIKGFYAFALLMVSIELVGMLGNAGRIVYLIEALDPKTRVITQAFSRSWLNVGWGLGAAVAGAALAFDRPVGYHAMVFINVFVMFLNTVMIRRLPAAPHKPVRATEGRPKREVFRDRPFLAVAGVLALLTMHGTISLEVAPLWLITHTDAPKWTLAVLTGVNTLMATTLQVAMTRGSHTIAGGRRVTRWAGWVGAACCPVFYLSGLTSAWATVLLLVLATVLVTMSELWQSAAMWTLTAELAPADRRGEYQGAARMLGSVENMLAPAALIALAVTTGGWGWFVIAGLFGVAAFAAGPAVDWASRSRVPTLRSDTPTVEAAAVG